MDSTSSRPPPNSTVPVLLLQLLFDYLDAKGVVASEFVSLNRPSVTMNPLAAIPAKAFCDELIRVSEKIDDPLLGVHVGARIRIDHLGTLGDAFRSCGTVAEALLSLMHYKALLHATHDMEIRPTGEHIVLEWPVNSWYFGRVFDELGLNAMVQIARELAGTQDIVTKVEFVNSPPASIEPYRNYFGADILFNRPATKIYAAADLLGRPLAKTDRKSAAALDQQIRAWMEAPENTAGLEGDTRRAIVQLTREGMPSLEQVAENLELSPRQLARQLNDLGLSFRGLREDSLRSLAEGYLKSRDLSLTDIAHLLGYSEQSVLSRAAKRWTGKSARQWRKELSAS